MFPAFHREQNSPPPLPAVWPALDSRAGTVVLLAVFAVLAVVGIGESAYVAVAMFARAPLVGLSVTPDVCCRLLASTADKVRRLGRSYQLPRPADTSLRAPGRGHDA